MGTNEIVNRLKVTKYITSTKDNQTIIDEAEIEGSNPVDAGSGENSVMIDAYGNAADGEASVALGIGVQAENDAESAFGKYNKSNEGTIHSVGVGVDDDHRENAFEILDDGSVYVKGVGGYTGSNPLPGTNDLSTTIAGIKQFTYVFADTLPEASADTMYIIYFIPAPTPAQQNNKDEYITVDNGDGADPRYAWEQIGSATVDLSAYSTTAEMNAAIAAAVPWEAAVGTGSVIVKNSGNVADNNYEVATGVYNKSNTGTQFSVGIGTDSDHRKNAFEILNDGSVYVKGVGGYDGTTPTSGTNDLKTAIDAKPNASNVPWEKGTGNDSALLKGSSSTAGGAGAVAEGSATVATGTYSHTEGRQTTTTATGEYAHAEGYLSQAQQAYSHAEGFTSIAGGQYSHAEGAYAQTTHPYEHAEGIYNKSHTKTDGTAAENKAGTTQMSIGVGTTNNNRINAFEVMQSGDIYVKGVGDFNGASISSSTTSLQKTITNIINSKINGTGITDVIKLTEEEYEALADRSLSTLYVVAPPEGVFIGYTDGSLSSVNDPLVSGKTPVGVVVINNKMSIVLHPSAAIAKWANVETPIPGVNSYSTGDLARTDYDGEGNTDAAINSGLVTGAGAFTWARSVSYANGAVGYLPAGGEMYDIWLNETAINRGLTKLSGVPVFEMYQGESHIWTSTQSTGGPGTGDTYAYMMYDATHTLDTQRKSETFVVRSVAKWPVKETKLYIGSTLITDSTIPEQLESKADKPVSPIDGHLVKVNASGGLLDAGLAMVKMTETEYEALVTKDPSTLYLVTPPSGVFIGYTDKSLSSYNTLVSEKTPVGVVLINENVSLVLHKTKFSNCLWATEQSLIPGMQTYANREAAALDFDGAGNTSLVIASGFAGDAFTNAVSTAFADGSSGYVPSGGEALALFANATNINTALSLLSGDTLSDNMWTSSQTNAEQAWMYFARFNRLDFAGKNNSWMESRVVATWPKDGIKVYLGSTLIADSNLPSDIASILATI